MGQTRLSFSSPHSLAYLGYSQIRGALLESGHVIANGSDPFCNHEAAMPRPHRIAFAGAIYHITAHGINDEPVFVHADDRQVYIALLSELLQTKVVRLLAYILMTNHIHLVLQTAEPNVSEVMQRLHGRYAAYFNRRYGRRGHLFGDRFWSDVVDSDEYLLEVSGYVHLNPVRAGVSDRPEDYEWSSFRDYMGTGSGSAIVDPMPVLALLSSDQAKARTAYAIFVGESLELRSRMTPLPVMEPESLKTILVAVARAFDMTLQEIRRRKRGSQARAVACYLARMATGLPYAKLGRVMGVRASTISKGIARVRRLRSFDASLRKRLAVLEATLKA